MLLIAAVVAIATRRLNLPYSVGLAAVGILLGILPYSPRISLTRDLLFTVLLPPLIFEAAFYINWKLLRRDLGVIVALATFGVALSAGVTTVGMHYLAGWQWLSAAVFGVLIAATDPVAVIATFNEAGVGGRLRLLLESESLFNDGTAAVAFGVALEFLTGETPGPLQSIFQFVITAGGGLLCGFIVAGAALALAGRTQDHLVEITLTTVAAWGSFLLAEHFGASGVLASMAAGLIVGNVGSMGIMTSRGKEAAHAFWEFAAFVANSLVFLLMGMQVAHENFVAVWLTAVIAIALVLLGRAAAVYPVCGLFHWSAVRVPWREQHILFWGGLRGALALALSLALPAEMPQRDTIITLSFAVVTFSIFVQGVSIIPLARGASNHPVAAQVAK